MRVSMLKRLEPPDGPRASTWCSHCGAPGNAGRYQPSNPVCCERRMEDVLSRVLDQRAHAKWMTALRVAGFLLGAAFASIYLWVLGG